MIDLDLVVERYREVKNALPDIDVYYAVKANPADEIITALADEGSCFDVASIPEMEAGVRLGIAERMSYGADQEESDIEKAHAAGIELFAFDSAAEMENWAERRAAAFSAAW